MTTPYQMTAGQDRRCDYGGFKSTEDFFKFFCPDGEKFVGWLIKWKLHDETF